MRKFMVAFDEKVFRELDRDARSRNISLQAFLRPVVVPEWIKRGEVRTARSVTRQEVLESERYLRRAETL